MGWRGKDEKERELAALRAELLACNAKLQQVEAEYQVYRNHAMQVIDRDERRYDTLFKAYSDLRPTQAPLVAPTVNSPMSQLGPLTKAALSDMERGQSGAVKRAQQNKALAIWYENRGVEQQDELTAIAVRNGEPL